LRLLESGPNIALEVESITDPTWKSHINYRKLKEIKIKDRNFSESVSSADFEHTESKSDEKIQRIVKRKTSVRSRAYWNTRYNSAMIIRTRDINIAKFYGYRREDIEQWLDESEYHLQTRDISPTSRNSSEATDHTLFRTGTGIYPSTPVRVTRNGRRRCYSHGNRVWVQRQLLAQRGKISGEPLGIYVSDIATKQNKLDMQENTRVYHFIEGLKPELQMEDLKVKPKTPH